MSFYSFSKENGAPKFVKKNDHVFMQGDSGNALYIVRSGLLKAYYVSTEGKESIKSFIKPGSTIASLNAVYKGGPCTFNLIALQDSELIEVPFAGLLEATQLSHEIAGEVIKVLLSHSIKKEQREYEFLTLLADERYQRLCEEEPDLLKHVTQNDIARYLGITPVALSRIKKRLNSV